MRDRDSKKCPECGVLMTRPPTLNKPFANVWKPITLEHIADEPMTFNTRQSLRDHCKKTGLSSGALL